MVVYIREITVKKCCKRGEYVFWAFAVLFYSLDFKKLQKSIQSFNWKEVCPPVKRQTCVGSPFSAWIFFQVESYQRLKNWFYGGVTAGTGWPGVCIMWPGEMESLICSFYLSVAAWTCVWANPFLRYTSLLLGHEATIQPTDQPQLNIWPDLVHYTAVLAGQRLWPACPNVLCPDMV